MLKVLGPNRAKELGRSPPGIGEHTDEILAELGYDAETIASLRSDEAV